MQNAGGPWKIARWGIVVEGRFFNCCGQMPMIQGVYIADNCFRQLKRYIVDSFFMAVFQLNKFVIIVAAAAFFLFHTTAATFVCFAAIQIGPGILSHAIVYLHGYARRHRQVEKGQYA